MYTGKKLSLYLVPLVAFCVVLLYAWGSLTIKPKPFFDEGLIIEVAHNFDTSGVLDVMTSPQVFSGLPYVAGSSGFPTTLPLAAFFHFFGFGLFQARVYALLWIAIFFGVSFFVIKKTFSTTVAVSALALFVTFAPFYDNGLRASGEIPGITFLFLSFYALAFKKKYAWGGVLAGLSMASRPSIYLFSVPVFLLLIFIEKKDIKDFLKKGSVFLCGVLPALLVWIALAFPNPFSIETWQNALLFYKNPFGTTYDPLLSILNNVKSFISQPTLLYFLILWMVSLLAFFWKKQETSQQKLFLLFVLCYGILDLLYFLKSPGWLRYLLPLQLLTFPLLFSSFEILGKKISSYISLPIRLQKLFPVVALSLLVFIQGVHLLYAADIYASNEVQETVAFVEKNIGEGTVGVISAPHIASLLPKDKTYHLLTYNDILTVGENPLDYPLVNMPTLIIIADRDNATTTLTGKNGSLEKNYTRLDTFGRWGVFKKK